MTISINPIFILFGAELIILIILLALWMFLGRRKYKKLYTNLLAKSNTPDYVGSIKSKEASLPNNPDEPSSADINSQEMPIEEATDHVSSDFSVPKDVEALESSEADKDTFDTEYLRNKEDSDSNLNNEDSGSIKKLKGIVDFQKEKIINLMCYKDILESAQKKLTDIHGDYKDLSDRFTAISNAMGDNKDFELSLEMFGENTNELKEFIDALTQENDSLLNKFNTWENQLKQLWQESDEIAMPSETEGLDDMMIEKNEMLEKIKEFEDKLNEKTKQLEAAQSQYEDLESEYMTLYRQQQASASQPG